MSDLPDYEYKVQSEIIHQTIKSNINATANVIIWWIIGDNIFYINIIPAAVPVNFPSGVRYSCTRNKTQGTCPNRCIPDKQDESSASAF